MHGVSGGAEGRNIREDLLTLSLHFVWGACLINFMLYIYKRFWRGNLRRCKVLRDQCPHGHRSVSVDFRKAKKRPELD
jgi:hypothetical protein